jgi:predicted ATP-dependent serine protease
MKNCPHCSKEIQEVAIKCKHCKEWLNKAEEPTKMESTTKNCPYCDEEIQTAAKKCKHCKEWLTISEEEVLVKATNKSSSPKVAKPKR